MPIRNEKYYCINHTDTLMIRNSGFNALISASKLNTSISFDSTKGIPIVVFSCPICGYIESYAAQKTTFWNEYGGSITNDAFVFERDVIENIKHLQHIMPHILREEVVIQTNDNKKHVVGAIIESEKHIYLIEITKQTHIMEIIKKISQLKKYIEAFKENPNLPLNNKEIRPLLIIPDNTNIKIPDIVSETAILKFDELTKQFTNEYILQI